MQDTYRMTNMTHELVADSALTLGWALRSDPLTRKIYNQMFPADRAKQIAAGFEIQLKYCVDHGAPLCITSPDGVPVGAASIYPPGKYPFPLRDQVGIVINYVKKTGVTGIAKTAKWLIESSKYHDRATKEPLRQNHYYLEYLGIAPSEQGQGLGKAILHHLIRMASNDQCGVFLETSNDRNLSFYESFGFSVVEQTNLFGVDVYYMWFPSPIENAADNWNKYVVVEEVKDNYSLGTKHG